MYRLDLQLLHLFDLIMLTLTTVRTIWHCLYLKNYFLPQLFHIGGGMPSRYPRDPFFLVSFYIKEGYAYE